MKTIKLHRDHGLPRRCGPSPRLFKALILCVLLLLGHLTSYGSESTATPTVTLTKTASIAEVLKAVEKACGYSSFYNNKQVDLSRQVSVNFNDTKLADALTQIFSNTDYTFSIEGVQIIIKEKNVVTQNEQPQSMHSIAGVVVDSHGQPIFGATIAVPGTSSGTTSDQLGRFHMELEPDTKLFTVEAIGYNRVNIAVTGVSMYDVVLQDGVQLVDEVIVIGYGRVKKEDATGSVLAIKPDQMNKGSQTSMQDALLGKIPGVNITPGSGAPGDGGTIRIRSGSSLAASNDPLIVIDGVPVDNSSIEGSTNILSTINPNDIESFTVLKDASSTAIYGSRASNGVIIITTKKGTATATPKVNYNNNFSIGNITKKIGVLGADDYRAFIAEHYASSPTVVNGVGNTSTDWQDEIYRISFGQEHNASVTGNLQNIPYRVSLGYTNQDGIVETNNYQRLTTSVALSPAFFDRHLTLNLNAKYSYERNRDIDGGVVASAVGFDPTRPVMESNANGYGLGYFTWLSSGGEPLTIASANPVAGLKLRRSISKINRSIGSAAIDYKLHGLEDLRLNLNVGYDVMKSEGTEEIPDNAPVTYVDYKKDGQGLDRRFTQRKRNHLLDFYLNYNKTIGIHNIDVMAGYGWQHFWAKYNNVQLTQSGAEMFSPTHSESEYYLVSFYGRVNYGIASKYLFTATLRADASSRFAKNNRWGYFPSGAFAWRISQEDFMRDVNFISDLKLRLSYGQTGQQDIGSDYPYMSTYTASTDGARYQFGDQWYTTYRADGYDPNIKWESTETYNAGLDFGFLNGRIYGSVDAYLRKTKDLLNKIPVAAGSNLASEIFTNVGSMENKGIEFAINAVPIAKGDWHWDMGVNVTYNKSEITKLNTVDSDSYGVLVGPVSGTGKTVQIHSVGYAPYTFYLARQAYDDDGKPIEGKYVQADGSVSSTETLYRTKSPTPKVYLGISSKLQYKEWDLGFNAHASFGHYIYNYIRANDYKDNAYNSNTYSNILSFTRNSGFTQQQLYSDYFLEKGDFFRMDNITLGYTFNKLFKSDMTLRLAFSVQNVFVITGYDGLDPEAFYRSGSTSYVGIDKNLYPRPRMYMFGLNLNF